MLTITMPAVESLSWVYVCEDSEIDTGQSRRILVKGVPVAVWKLEDGYYAIEDACPHQKASLAFGRQENGIVACPRHGAEFNIRTGRVLSLQAVRGVRNYDVKVEQGEVLVSADPVSDEIPDILRLAEIA